jgi:Flp pilus assembly protein TadG
MRRLRRDRVRGESGATALELAIVTPALLLAIFTAIQVALWFHAREVALASAQEGARVLRSETGTEAAARDRTLDFVQQLGGRVLERPSVTASRTTTVATVEVRGTSVALVPGMRLPVQAVSSGTVERFVPDS